MRPPLILPNQPAGPHPCHAGHRLLYAGYLFAGTAALALVSLSIGETSGWLLLRGLCALFAASLLRTYLQQAGQFDACADSLAPTEDGLSAMSPPDSA